MRYFPEGSKEGMTDCAAHNGAVVRADHHAAGFKIELLTGKFLQLAPKFVGTLDERDVAGMLKVSLANDPRFAMRRTEVVRWIELIKAKDIRAALSEMIRGGGTHRAEAKNGDIIFRAVCGGHAGSGKDFAHIGQCSS